MSFLKSAESRILDAAVKGNSSTLEKALRKHPEFLDTEDANGRTALWFAVANGHIRMAEELIQRGANVNPPHCSPLYTAVQRRRAELVAALVQAGANLDFVAGDGTVPLVAAIDQGNIDLVRTLLTAKANPNGTSKQNPLHFALRKAAHAAESLRTFRKGGSDFSASANKAQNEVQLYQQIAHLLVDAGADLRVTSRAHQNSGITVLYRASEIGDVALARRAIEQGVSVDAQDEWGVAALHNAASNGHEEVARLVLQHGADVNIKDRAGATPVCLAAWGGHLQVVRLLLDRKADLSIRRDGETPLFYAKKFGTPEVVELLTKHGAG